ncbi:MAG: zinc-finger domain-containing protein [Burkholderiales bacterium]|nr:zinc-finger domain-containing protein [Burkholderiales bacterium]
MDDNAVRRPICIEVTDKDLPLHCPTPAMALWNSHPRVFLDIERTGEAMCPYCGTRFSYQGEGRHQGH